MTMLHKYLIVLRLNFENFWFPFFICRDFSNQLCLGEGFVAKRYFSFKTNSEVLPVSITDEEQDIYPVCKTMTSQKSSVITSMIDFRLYKTMWPMTSGECFLSPLIGQGENDWKLVFDNPCSNINISECESRLGAREQIWYWKAFEGVEISFELQWKELVLNEHRLLTNSPHPKPWTSENTQC